MINGKLLVEKLIEYSKLFLNLVELDVTYVRNILLSEFKLSSPLNQDVDLSYISTLEVPDTLIYEISTYALENNICDNNLSADLFSNYIMGILTQKPSEVNSHFMMLKENLGSQVACDYLYNLSIKNNYIRKTDIDKNIEWEANNLDYPIEVTINLSKPEKDNKDIAKLLTINTENEYPMCQLCKENEGFYGSLTKAPRTNLRTISLSLGGEDWAMQYSPYSYYNEHCILFNKKHTPMNVSGHTVTKLFDFIELFPNYFIGSNSDLPIVGGSILNHEHYQGGKHLHPLQKAGSLSQYYSIDYNDVSVDVIDFYNSSLRLAGFNRNTVEEFASEVISKWKNYSDESVGIICNENGVQHNTTTTIARFLPDNRYCIEIILRNNITSLEYPNGVFHTHPENFNIKKEGIGLIEAMGRFILPARLQRQFSIIAKILTGELSYDDIKDKDEYKDLSIHNAMINCLLKKHRKVKDENKANEIIKNYVNNACSEILYNTAVFKKDKKGKIAFNKFLTHLQLRPKN